MSVEVTGICAEKWAFKEQERPCAVTVNIAKNTTLPCFLVRELATAPEGTEVICWYEGTRGLPVRAAKFYEKEIFAPLYAERQDLVFTLYSLLGWEFKFSKNVNRIKPSKLSESIDRVGKGVFTCKEASSFFRRCQNPKKELANCVAEILSDKEYLRKLSADREPANVTVREFFDNRDNLFDCIGNEDANRAYSKMQYIEAYIFFIRSAVERALQEGKKTVNVFFALQNNEGNFYQEGFSKDLEKMLKCDFGDQLKGMQVGVAFRFFEYGDGKDDRTYIDRTPKAPFVDPKNVDSYWNFLKQFKYIPRDIIHNLNGGL